MKTGAFFYAFRMLFVPLGGRRDSGKVRGAVFGIVLSLIPVVVVIQTASGMIDGIIKRYLEIGSFHIVGQSYLSDFNANAAAVAAAVSEVPGVKSAVPIGESHCLLAVGARRSAAAVKGVPPSLYESDAGFAHYFKILDGAFDLTDGSDLLLSDGLAQTLGAAVGDTVRLLTAAEAAGRPILKSAVFTVSGIFSTGYYELDQMTAYISRNRMKELFSSQVRTAVAIKLTDLTDETAAQISSELNKRFGGEGIFFRTWKEKNRSLVENLESTFFFVSVIAVLIVFLAAVNIFSIMVALELEKRTAVAILRSLGVPKQTIFTAFLSVGLLVGICGAFVGLSLGLLAAVNLNTLMEAADAAASFFFGLLSGINGDGFFQHGIEILNKDYYLEDIPLVIQWKQVCAVAVLAVVVSGAAALIPAVAAVSRKPSDVIKDI